MQIVIKLSDKIYDTILNDEMPTHGQVEAIVQRIYEGTPLPKGHGRLIDADALIKSHTKLLNNSYGIGGLSGVIFENVSKEDIQHAPTIIEADNAESEVEE